MKQQPAPILIYDKGRPEDRPHRRLLAALPALLPALFFLAMGALALAQLIGFADDASRPDHNPASLAVARISALCWCVVGLGGAFIGFVLTLRRVAAFRSNLRQSNDPRRALPVDR